VSLALVLIAASLAGPVAAVPQRGGPAVVTGDEVKYNYPKRQVTLTGAPVRLTRDDAVLTCRRLVADQDDAGRIVRATCAGDVRLVRGPRVVSCETAVYEDAAARVTCEGSPVVLRDGATEARGDKLTYDLASDEVTLGKANASAPGAELEAKRKQLDARRKAGGAKP
jgi:lipopolysaccharide export system protein LptA